MSKHKIRRFVVTIEEIEPDALAVEHQKPAAVQTREAREAVDWWLTAAQRYKKRIAERRERARVDRQHETEVDENGEVS